MANNKEIAANVLEAVGGKSNVSFVAHCMTRLRFNLKDRALADEKAIKKIDGVLGAQDVGGQLQVIIGQNVPKVYSELCAMGGFAKQESIDENLDGSKEKLTLKKIGNNVLNYLSGSMVPLIPVLMCASLFKVFATLLGPSMFNVAAEDSDIIVLMNMVYNAGFYFLPVYVGYNAAKKLNASPMMGAFLGAVLIEPSFVEMAAAREPFTVYGLPCMVNDYTNSVMPILLSVWIMSYVERFVSKYMPDALSTIFTPLVTMLIMLPISLCALAPLGSILGLGISVALNTLGNMGGIFTILAMGLVTALWIPLVITGMHITLFMLSAISFMETGHDSFILVATVLAMWAFYGAALATWLKLRDPNEKAKAFGYLVAGAVGGVSEPFIYGMMFRYRRLFAGVCVGGFIGGVVSAILNVNIYAIAASNVLSVLAFVAGGTPNLVNFAIAAVVAFVAGAVVTYLFGFTKDELENGPLSERA